MRFAWLRLVACMSGHHVAAQSVERTTEPERDGLVAVTGRCSTCWAVVGMRLPPSDLDVLGR